MLYFADIQYLWLLLLVPLFPVAYAIFRKMRRRRMEKLGDKALMERLMPSWSRSRGWWQVSLFSLGFAFFQFLNIYVQIHEMLVIFLRGAVYFYFFF